MKTRELILTKPGGFFKHEGLVYKAHEKKLACLGCCFLKHFKTTDPLDVFMDPVPCSYCDAPENLVCKDLVFEDVTGKLDDMNVELVDKKANLFPWIIVATLLLWGLVITVLTLITQ